LADGSITDATGAISFGDEDLSTTGDLSVANATTTGTFRAIGNVTLATTTISGGTFEITGDVGVNASSSVYPLSVSRTVSSGIGPRTAKIDISTSVNDQVAVALQVDGTTTGSTTNAFVIPIQINSNLSSTYTGADLNGLSGLTIDNYIGYADETTFSSPTTLTVSDFVGIQVSLDRQSQFDDTDATYFVSQAYGFRAFIDGGAQGGNNPQGKMTLDNYYAFFADNWRLAVDDAKVNNFYAFYVDPFWDIKQAPDDQLYADLCFGCPASKSVGEVNNYGFYVNTADAGTGDNVGVYINDTNTGSAGGTVNGLVFDGDLAEAVLIRKNNDGGDVFTVDTGNSRILVGGFLNIETPASETLISSGTLTAATSTIQVGAETGTADNLDTIQGGSAGDILIIQASSGDAITVTESGNIVVSGTSRVLDSIYDRLVLQKTTNVWVEVSYADNL